MNGDSRDEALRDAQDDARSESRRLQKLLDAVTELLEALDEDHARDSGDVDAEAFCAIRVAAARMRLEETTAYLKKTRV